MRPLLSQWVSIESEWRGQKNVFFLKKKLYFYFLCICKIKWPKSEEKNGFGGTLGWWGQTSCPPPNRPAGSASGWPPFSGRLRPPLEKSRSRSEVKVKWAKNSIFQTVYRITFHLPTDYAQIAPAGVHRHQFQGRQRNFKVNVKGQGQIGQKLDFLDGVPHNFFHLQTDCAQIAPAGVHLHQLGSRQRKLKVNVKGQG